MTSKGETISLFGEEVGVKANLTQIKHKDYYLKILDIDSLDIVRVDRSLSKEEMIRCVTLLLKYADSSTNIQNPLSIYLFTLKTHLTNEIELENTHAFSIILYNHGELEHYYYEKGPSQKFQEVKELCCKVDGPIDSDTLRLLHFASTPGFRLPPQSTIFMFSGGEIDNLFYRAQPDETLQKAVLMDSVRNKGSVGLGLGNPEIYIALLDNDPTPDFTCGHNDGCDLGPDKCVYQPDVPFQYCSHLPAPPDCAVAHVAAMKTKQLFFSNTAIRFSELRFFRDEFLSKSNFGRKYIGYYYLLSRHARYDSKSVRDYVTAFPHLYKSIKILMSNSLVDDNKIIVTPELWEIAHRIIEKHRDIDEPLVQIIITTMESDLNRLYKLKKKDFLRAIGMSPGVQLI